MPSSATRHLCDRIAHIYVLDFFDNLHKITVRRSKSVVVRISASASSVLSRPADDTTCNNSRRILDCNVWLFHYILNECLSERWNRTNFIRSTRHNGGHPIDVLLRLQAPRKEPIEYEWCEMNLRTVYTHAELDHLTSWLSTLGGGYSALGDSMDNCAEIAGRISIYQFRLAMQFGDPPLVARSKLYMAIALIQKHRLRFAKYLTRFVYQQALAERDVDERLVNMCHGIWLKLQWAYSQRGVRAA